MKFSLLSLAVLSSFIPVYARPDIQDGQTGVLMVLPPRQTDTGTKRVPDADHPFIAPGPNDMRGPCPAMNTLANHGYISRNGITNFQEIIRGTAEAFNIDRDMSSGMAALNLLTRGNPFVNKISIGGISPFVPPLPGRIDGPETQGIAKHGRVEGDASMTRSDVHIGDNRNFNQTLWDEDLAQLAKFGDDGPDGPATVFNLQTLIEMKRQNLESDQALDPEFAIPIRRLNAAFGAPSLIMSVFANGTTKQATKRIISSFFMNQTFPENWHRAGVPVLGSPIPAEITAALPQWVPGHNDENGVFVADPQAPAPFNISGGCANYWDTLVNAVPGTMANVTGIFKQNVDMLNGILFNASGCAEPLAPAGPTNV
ncbi:Chloroperoxidase [Mycena polygramma]|nr:Chloroperoxidase [Mycena polygramma]